jgi:hypothetical protein
MPLTIIRLVGRFDVLAFQLSFSIPQVRHVAVLNALADESAHVVPNEFAHIVSVFLLVFSIVIGPEGIGPKELLEVLFNEHLVKCFHFAPDAPQVGLLQWEVVHVDIHEQLAFDVFRGNDD